MKILGIARASVFSPNMVDNDVAILNAVARILSAQGHDVRCVSENDFTENSHAELIFSMARHISTIRVLKKMEEERHIHIVNSATGVENCIRKNFTALFIHHGIPTPESWIFRPDNMPDLIKYPCWIKRGDSCAQTRNDVSYAEDEKDATIILNDFISRGVSCAVANKHLKGDLIKFYGVEGTDFFDWGYASDGHSKFGLEARNGKACGYCFSPDKLKNICDAAAKLLDVPVYGGDCIVSCSGELHIIDFNDWPSFSRCRAKAAEAIAKRIVMQ